MAADPNPADTPSSPGRGKPAVKRRRSNVSGAETKDKLLDAALRVVATEGLIGTSARAIAKEGGVNQALVFYHFGSVEELMLESLDRAGRRRMERHRERLEKVSDLSELVAIAVDLHAGPDDPDAPALTAIVAGWSQNSDMGPRVLAMLEPWNDLLADAIRRSLGSSPLAQIVPAAELAHGMSALFLGIEVYSRLDPHNDRTERLFVALQALARLIDPAMGALGSMAPPKT